MKFVISQKELLHGLSMVQRMIPQNAVLPALQYIHFEVVQNSLLLSATNLSQSMEYELEIEGNTSGHFLVNGRMFSDIIRRLSGDITIEVRGDQKINISAMGTKVTVSAYDSSEFPEIHYSDYKSHVTLSSALLEEMISHVMVSIKKIDDANPILTGTLFKLQDGTLTCVGLDGYRISKIQRPLGQKLDHSIDEIIPRRVLEELLHMMRSIESDTLSFGFYDDKIFIEMGPLKMLSSLIEGKFIQYDAIISDPEKMATKVTALRSELLTSIDLAYLISSQNKNKTIKLHIEEGCLQITSQSDMGDFFKEIPIEMTGVTVEIGFNAIYLLEALKSYTSEEVELYFDGSLKPLIMTPAEEGDLHMILPVKMR